MTHARLGTALAYFIAGWLGLQIPFVATHISLVWLPTGIAVAAIIRWGRHVWPGIWLGSFLVNLTIGADGLFPWLMAGSIAITSTLAPLLSVAVLTRLKFDPGCERPQDIWMLILAALAGMLVSSLGGVANLYLFGRLPVELLLTAQLSWWMGDAVGVVLAAPLILSFKRDNLAQLGQARNEIFLWVLAAVMVIWLAFLHEYPDIGHATPLVFLSFPLLIWAGMRFNAFGGALASVFFSMTAAWATATGRGPFVLQDVQFSLILLWAYMTTAVLSVFIITGLEAARGRVVRELAANASAAQSRARLQKEMATISLQLQQQKGLEELARAFLTAAAFRLGMRQGVCYLADPDQGRLRRLATYACGDESAIPPELAYGDGLLGQCAADKKAFSVSNPASTAWKIVSGLGQARPSELLVAPVILNNAVQGVVELALLNPLDASRRQLFEEMLPLLALNLEIKRHQRPDILV